MWALTHGALPRPSTTRSTAATLPILARHPADHTPERLARHLTTARPHRSGRPPQVARPPLAAAAARHVIALAGDHRDQVAGRLGRLRWPSGTVPASDDAWWAPPLGQLSPHDRAVTPPHFAGTTTARHVDVIRPDPVQGTRAAQLPRGPGRAHRRRTMCIEALLGPYVLSRARHRPPPRVSHSGDDPQPLTAHGDLRRSWHRQVPRSVVYLDAQPTFVDRRQQTWRRAGVQYRVRHSFRHDQGSVLDELLRAAKGNDPPPKRRPCQPRCFDRLRQQDIKREGRHPEIGGRTTCLRIGSVPVRRLPGHCSLLPLKRATGVRGNAVLSDSRSSPWLSPYCSPIKPRLG